jgi:hypothetical protein
MAPRVLSLMPAIYEMASCQFTHPLPLLRKSEILIVRTTVVGMIAKAEHAIRPALDCSAA